jgi:hypothetical protein
MGGGLSEGTRLDAHSFPGQPFLQLGLVRFARSDHHLVATTQEAGC